jgi:hypothetical protein
MNKIEEGIWKMFKGDLIRSFFFLLSSFIRAQIPSSHALIL